MAGETHRVVLVVDRTLGERLLDLARFAHVWAVESPDNTPAIQRQWRAEPLSEHADPLGPGITSFAASDLQTPEGMCMAMAGDIDDHHSGYGETPAWSEVEVIGVPLNDALRSLFEELGATSFETTETGFVCRR